MELNEKQEQDLRNAYRCACHLGFADLHNNHSTCGSFHIRPFNTEWHEKTAKEVMYHVQLYVNTWIAPVLGEVLGETPREEEMKALARWHREQALMLENHLKTK